MSNTKHTPGEWKVAMDGFQVWADNKITICEVSEKRDAKVIAASKDLLEALQAMKEAHSHIGGIGRDRKKLAHDKAEAAIKKATE